MARTAVWIGSVVLMTTLVTTLGGCTSAGPSVPDRLAERAERTPLVIDDAVRATEARAAFEGMRDAAVAIEASVERARVDILALHHDPDATPEDFRAALDAMRRRNVPLLDAMLRGRVEAASATTPGEWNELARD